MTKRYRSGTKDTTEGPILRALVALAVPIVATNIFQTLYQLIDTFWVGRLGAGAVAAVSLSFPILFFMISAGGGLAVAGSILVAQTFGTGDEEAVDYAAGQTLLAVGVVSALLSVAGFILSEPLMALFRAEPAVTEMAVGYLEISFLGLVAVFVYFVFHALLRGVGDVRTPMTIAAGTVFLGSPPDPRVWTSPRHGCRRCCLGNDQCPGPGRGRWYGDPLQRPLRNTPKSTALQAGQGHPAEDPPAGDSLLD